MPSQNKRKKCDRKESASLEWFVNNGFITPFHVEMDEEGDFEVDQIVEIEESRGEADAPYTILYGVNRCYIVDADEEVTVFRCSFLLKTTERRTVGFFRHC